MPSVPDRFTSHLDKSENEGTHTTGLFVVTFDLVKQASLEISWRQHAS